MSDRGPLEVKPLPTPAAVERWKRPVVRNSILVGILIVALLGAGLFAYLAMANNQKQQQVTQNQDETDTARAQAAANCQTIKQLGGICPADLEEIRKGQPPPPPYTDQQVIKIVNEALAQFKRDNPDAVGLGEEKVLEIVQNYVATHPSPGRLPSDDTVRALIKEIIASDPSLKGPPGENGNPGIDGKDGIDGQDGKDGADGAKGDKGDPGSTTCPTGYHFEERRADELVCVRDTAQPAQNRKGLI